MLDYYSEQSAPSIDICIQNVKNKKDEYNNYILDTLYNITDVIRKAIYMSNILDENKNIKYSYTGWYVFGIKEVLKYMNNNINDINIEIEKDIKRKRKLKGIFKSSIILLTIYFKTKENMYHPDSIYVNTNLKNNFNILCCIN